MVRGKGRLAKVSRGGGRHFSKHMGADDGEGLGGRASREKNDDEDSEEEDDSEEESEEEDESEEGEEKTELTRAEKRDQKRAKVKIQEEDKNEEDPELINPNHVQQKMNISDLNTPRELTRREREQKEKQEAKDRYWKLHVQGKTDEAKADLSRLAKVRAEREAAQAKRVAEAEAKAAEVEAKKKAQLAKRT